MSSLHHPCIQDPGECVCGEMYRPFVPAPMYSSRLPSCIRSTMQSIAAEMSPPRPMWRAAGGIVVVEGRVWHDPCRIDRSIMAEGGINPIWCLSCDRLQQVVWRSGNGVSLEFLPEVSWVQIPGCAF